MEEVGIVWAHKEKRMKVKNGKKVLIHNTGLVVLHFQVLGLLLYPPLSSVFDSSFNMFRAIYSIAEHDKSHLSTSWRIDLTVCACLESTQSPPEHAKATNDQGMGPRTF